MWAGQHFKASLESYLAAVNYCFLKRAEWRITCVSWGQTKMRSNSIASQLLLPPQLHSWFSFLLLPSGGKHKVWWKSAVISHLSTEVKAHMQWYYSPLLLGGAAGSSESERDGFNSLPPKKDPVPGVQPLCFSHKPKGIILCTWGSTCL